MTKSLLKLASIAAASVLALSACAQAPTTNPTAEGSRSSTAAPGSQAPASDFKACMVSDFGGFDDKSFNETSYKGLQRAK